MEFIIQGLRKSGNEVDKTYQNYKIAKFEFECLELVSQYLAMYQKDKRGMKQLKLFIKE